MSTWWLAPLALPALTLAWYGVQRAWLRAMARPAGDDALARPGCAGPDGRGCRCQAVPEARRAEIPHAREVSRS